MMKVLLVAAFGVPLSMAPATEASANPGHWQEVHIDQTYSSWCGFAGFDRVSVSESINIEEKYMSVPVQPEGTGTLYQVHGVVTIAPPNGQPRHFRQDYVSSPYGAYGEVSQVTGWAIVGPGAIGEDIQYLEGGTALVDHYGVPSVVQGNADDVCAQLGLPSS